ncbi:MAG: hypothetical protein AAB518_02835 [Patescibacteria group bacterium]
MSLKAVFITFSILLILIIGGGGAYLWYQSRGARGLELALTLPDEVSAGVPFILGVSASNDSSSVLKNVELIVELPEGVVFVGSAPDKNFSSKTIGNLGAGSLAEETFELLALGSEQSVKEVRASITYVPESIQSKFEKETTGTFTVLGGGLAIDLSIPEQVFGGEEFEMIATYHNLSDSDFEDVRLRIAYPPSFTFKSSSPKPDSGNNSWNLGGLPSGADGEIKMRGSMIGADGSFFDVKATLEARFLGRSYVVSERSASIAIARSPLSLEIQTDRPADYTPVAGDTITYTLRFANNTDVGLSNVSLRAQLVGVMFDFATLSTVGSLRASDNTIVWNVSNTPTLSLLSPASSGEVNFRITLKDTYPIKKLSDKNFMLKVSGVVESPTVPQSVSADKTMGIATLETKVSGAMKIDARGFFRDASAGILNKGPWPLQAGKATNFTIHWVLTNFSTDLENVEVHAFLGSNVRFTGVAKTNVGAIPTGNEGTQEVIWNVGNLNAGKGILGAPAEAIFQIEVTPSVNQVGSGIVLLQPSAVKAGDAWTGGNLSATDLEVKSTMLDDPTVTANEGTVLP